MPEQIKHAAVECSAKCGNLIYANSGLYCIEREIENFASKHSAYNKCQMVYMFLNDVIDETNKRITYRAESLKKTREARKKDRQTAAAKIRQSGRSIPKNSAGRESCAAESRSTVPSSSLFALYK